MRRARTSSGGPTDGYNTGPTRESRAPKMKSTRRRLKGLDGRNPDDKGPDQLGPTNIGRKGQAKIEGPRTQPEDPEPTTTLDLHSIGQGALVTEKLDIFSSKENMLQQLLLLQMIKITNIYIVQNYYQMGVARVVGRSRYYPSHLGSSPTRIEILIPWE